MDYLLWSIYKNVGDAQKITVPKLLVVGRLLETETVKASPSHLVKVFSIVLEAHKSKYEMVKLIGRALLADFIHAHPSFAIRQFELRVKLAQGKPPNVYAIENLLFFATLYPSYVPKVFSLLMNAFQTFDEDQIEMIFVPKALEILQKLTAIEPAYLAELFSKAQAYMQQESADHGIKKQALSALGFVVQHSNAYTPEVVAIANRATQHNNSEVRKATLCLLDTILAANNQYAQDPTVLANIKKLSQTKNKEVRQLAEGLLEKYASSSNAKD